MQFVQVTHQNDHAEHVLIVPVAIVPNTSQEVGDAQIRANARLNLPWLDESPAHDGVAVICGGGPSLKDCLEDVAASGGVVFGLNAASGMLSRHDFLVDYQIIIDAKEETSALVDLDAERRIFSSQVHPETAKYADCLFHLANEGIDDLLPEERRETESYTLVGGGVSVGITALCVAYTMGFRRFELFGYDSSNRGSATHAYSQPMNANMPEMNVAWGGNLYRCSMPMKLQADAFIRYADALISAGCSISVHGDGLLPAMWNTAPMSEREKYQLLWARKDYRLFAPGEAAVERFASLAEPGKVIDFGCGTGRAALALAEKGFEPVLVDFTDNCRDKAALRLPFVQWDLADPIPIAAPYGFCTDVMEHIPVEMVDRVLANILAATDKAFFQIATVPDKFGATIGQRLHLTVRDHDWWAAKFPHVIWQERGASHSCFYVSKDNR